MLVILISNYQSKITRKHIMNTEILPQYDVITQNYTFEEKVLLGEIRENLVDLAISTGNNYHVSEEKLLNDIKNFLLLRLNDENQNY